jgi:hypothetical protein
MTQSAASADRWGQMQHLLELARAEPVRVVRCVSHAPNRAGAAQALADLLALDGTPRM